MAHLIQDGNILWLPIVKTGTPSPWEGGKTYVLGDVVVPRFIGAGQENLAFQVIGFIGASGSVEPTFPTDPGDFVEDGEIEWLVMDKESNPPALSVNEYYVIDETIEAI